MMVILSRMSKGQQSGFSLVELLIAIAVGAIVLAAISGVYTSLVRSYTTQYVAADIQEDLRAGVDIVVEDVMLAGLNPEEIANVGIVAASEFAIQITSDRNMNGAIDDADFENILYYLSGTQLIQRLYGDGTTDQPVVDNVTALRFSYFDDTLNTLTPPLTPSDLADIRTVGISIRVEEPAGRGRTVQRTYSSQVMCRNLGI